MPKRTFPGEIVAPDFSGPLPPESSEGEDSGDEGDLAQQLAQLGQALASVAGKRQARQQVVGQIEALLAKLTPRDYPELADSPAVQKFLEVIEEQHAASSDAPGTIYNRGSMAQVKKPWGWADLAPTKCEWLTFTPQESTTVTIQGLRATFIADVEWTGPRAFYDVYADSRRARRVAQEHVRYLFGQGGTPSDPTVINDASLLVRAMASGGSFYPGAGGFKPGEAPAGEQGGTSGEAA